MTKQKKIIISISAFAFVGIVSLFLFHKSAPEDAALVTRGDLIEAAYGVGTVKSDQTYTLKTGVNSRVLKRFVNAGQKVKKGDALILLDGFPTYTAPFDGVVSSISYDLGEVVFSQTSVLVLVNLNRLYMQLSMDERTIGGIHVGQEARISFEGQRSETAKGQVRAVYSNDGEFLIDVNFASQSLNLLPGMTADVAVQIAVHKDQLLVPVASLKLNKLMVLGKSQPQETEVLVGANDGKYAAVQSDLLKEGDRVLLQKTASRQQGPF